MSAGLSRRDFLGRAAVAPLAVSATTRRKGSVARAKRTLIVIDGGPGGRLHSTFGPGIVPADDTTSGDWFGFSEVVRALAAVKGRQLVRAHRDVDPGNPLGWAGDRAVYRPDIERFRFDAVDLSGFDQMWLFGIGNLADTARLADTENAAIARFMAGGGGVFATGDHADIGAAMCGRIPRVRSMRAWFAKDPPDNEPTAPDPIDAMRNDTTVWGAEETRESPDFRFNDQSDDRPAAITVTPAGRRHPLLSLGSGRTLTHLPDHMHEGAVLDPFDPAMRMSPTLTFAGEEFVEYPLAADGTQPRPQVLALGTTFAGTRRSATRSGTSAPTSPPLPGTAPTG